MSTKDEPLRAALRAKARKRANLQRLVDTWWEDACTGDSAAREQILKRLDPVTSDETSGRQVVFEGLRLELPDGTRAEVLRSQVQALQPLSDGSPAERSEGATYLLDTGDAVHDREESCGGPTPHSASGSTDVVQRVEESCMGSARHDVHVTVENPSGLSTSGLDGAGAPTAAPQGEIPLA